MMAEWLAYSFKTFSATTDRGSLINDAFSLAESGHLDYSIPLSMTRYLKKEKDLVPWKSGEQLMYIVVWIGIGRSELVSRSV
jgi:hypothetical protein